MSETAMPTWSNTRPRLPLPACSMYVTCGGCCAPSATIARLSPPSRTESPSMNQEEQVPQARPPAPPVDAEEAPVQKLERLGIRGILWQLARDGQLIDVRCEMPQCYCFRGRRYFDPRSARSDWDPQADHRRMIANVPIESFPPEVRHRLGCTSTA